MIKSNAKKIITLYKKEVRTINNETVFVLGFLIGFFLREFIKVNDSSYVTEVFGSVDNAFIYLYCALFIILFRSFFLMTNRYITMSLPVKGTSVLISKIAGTLTQLIIIFVSWALIFGGLWFMISQLDGEAILEFDVKKGLYGLVWFSYILNIIYFSCTIGKIAKRFEKITAFSVFLFTIFTINKGLDIIGDILNFEFVGANLLIFRDLRVIHSYNHIALNLFGCEYPTGDILFSGFMMLILSLGFLIVTGHLWDNKVDF
ncbi:hypothetical protein PRVXT_000612 [Proteinivorax tanatarense]|uniref:ABC transporter permease n=1 Tax=Proteinivorax tanatarense TaxID=1260629 RepID=A0AAU7VMZ6_9FIRM